MLRNPVLALSIYLSVCFLVVYDWISGIQLALPEAAVLRVPGILPRSPVILEIFLCPFSPTLQIYIPIRFHFIIWLSMWLQTPCISPRLILALMSTNPGDLGRGTDGFGKDTEKTLGLGDFDIKRRNDRWGRRTRKEEQKQLYLPIFVSSS